MLKHGRTQQAQVALPPRPAGERPVHRALFLKRHEETLTVGQAQGLARLMDLADNDLLDLLLCRREPEGDLDDADVRGVLAQMRAPAIPFERH